MKTSIWYGCYDETLKAFITPESFAHPAKMAKRLTERIFQYGDDQGYWKPGDLIIDPFGGIGTTALIGSYRGYRVISIELEPHFVKMQQANIAKNAKKLRRLGRPLPIVVQGDARHAAQLVSDAVGSIFFLPYAYGAAHTGGDDPHPEHMTGGKLVGVGLNGAISSPPYAGSVHEGNGIDASKLTGNPAGRNSQAFAEGYGVSDGQIGALREGDFNSVVGAISSPPYADQAIEKSSTSIDYTRQYQTYRAQGGGASFDAFVSTQQKHSEGYGASDGQIGALREGDFNSVAGAVTSPPWEDGLSNDRVDPAERVKLARELGLSNAEHVSAIDMEKIGKRPKGYVSGSVTSPPYEDGLGHGGAPQDIGSGGQDALNAIIGGHGITASQIGALSGGFDEVIGAVTSPPYEASVNTQDKGGIDWKKAGRPDRTVASDNRHGVQGDMPMTYGETAG